MNTQRKVLITITYNEMGIIIDTKAEEVAQPEHMHTVMLKIKEKYEKAMNTPCISNPMAWALYQTWKEYDR